MTATVDTLKNSSGQDTLVNGYPRQPGRIIEYLSGMCDGSWATVASGTYQFQNVRSAQASTTSYTNITGSSIDYVPPAGASAVTYRFHFSTYWQAAHAINHYKFFINDVEVVYARHCRSGQYIEDRAAFEWTIDIGGADNANTGRQATWNQIKTLYMQVRQYGGSNYVNLHSTYYFDGTTSNQFSMPQLSIIATA
jgi:hypothetical protein